MDINRELKSAIGTGKVLVGTKQAIQAAKSGKAKLVILTKNTPESVIRALARAKSAPVYRFDGTNMELGAACGKPFSISVLSILEPGDSDILSLQKDAPAVEAAPEEPQVEAKPKKKVAKKKAKAE